MKRRTLFGLSIGALLAPFFGRTSAAEIDHTIPERDANGKVICRIYRLGGDGTYREIRREEVRAGDQIVLIGQDGDRLWKAEALTVLETIAPTNGDSGGVTSDRSTVKLLVQ